MPVDPVSTDFHIWMPEVQNQRRTWRIFSLEPAQIPGCLTVGAILRSVKLRFRRAPQTRTQRHCVKAGCNPRAAWQAVLNMFRTLPDPRDFKGEPLG